MKKTFLILILSILVAALGACSSGNSASPAPSTNAAEAPDPAKSDANKEMDTVLVTEAFHTLLYLPLYVANKEGLFENNHIKISNIRSAGTGPTALASVLAGEAQFSVHGPEHVGFAKEKGGHAKAVSAVANSAPVWILANKNVAFNSPEDLRGKRIVVGLAPGTSNTLLKRLLRDHGLDFTKDVTVTEVQNGSELGPVLAGQADIAVAYQPQVEQGLSQGLQLIYNFTEEYPEYAFSTFNTSIQLMEKNPDLVKRFVKSMDESLKFIHQNPEIAKKVARAEFPELDGEVVDNAVQRMIDSNVYPPNANITEEAFKVAIDMQKFVGNIKTDMKYEDIVDASFIPNE
ncbi:ABC transporter substrate-binding protein [Paenibacillus naphthalenovorans]|uniref:ABC transporter substrate-binding protein n=1 Tax=Paenibacillus naphthalenovorans TaxID=162209 RepID=UPI00088E701A|nr:ABC transporter substrate-binding protein [Paenibacillus naphthalenovorans]SDJ31085.1 NitT/TauT family transport system substrate-binding protein [Paenibacillus naphthalenovorans]